MPRTNFQELLDAGVHFGHLKRKWNPNMEPFVFMEKKKPFFMKYRYFIYYFQFYKIR